MAEGDDLWSLFESGVKAGRQRAEQLLRGVVRDGEIGRERAEDLRDRGEELVEDLVARSRRGTEQVREMIRAEVRKELDAFVARRVEDVRREVVEFANSRRRDLADLVRRAGSLLGELTSAALHPSHELPELMPGPTADAAVLDKADAAETGQPAEPVATGPASDAGTATPPVTAAAAAATGPATTEPAERAPAKQAATKKAPAQKAAAHKAAAAGAKAPTGAARARSSPAPAAKAASKASGAKKATKAAAAKHGGSGQPPPPPPPA